MALTAVSGLLVLGTPALADLDLTVNVNKTKNVQVDVFLDVFKDIDIIVSLDEQYDGAAEAHALANVTNLGNTVDACVDSCEGEGSIGGQGRAENDNGIATYNLDLDALISDSVQNNEGIVGVNQDVGNMVNQANILAFARTEFTSEDGLIVSDAEAEIDQVNSENTAMQWEILPDDPIFDDPDHAATITGSVNNNNGIVGVNQNSGNMNNQTNAVAMVIGEGNAVVLTEAALGQENSFNEVVGVNTVKIDLLTDSVNGNSGVVSVNQSVGNMNNQGSAIAFGALKTSATVGIPGT
jgi:hypothetical protein